MRNPATGKTEAVLVSRDREIAMGDKAAGPFEKSFGGVSEDEALQVRVRTIGRRLVAVCDRPEMPYLFAVVRSGTPNAFALPGGRIYVTKGLVDMLPDDEQLAAVLAHEVAHVCALHAVKGYQREVGADALGFGVGFIPFGGYVGLAVDVGTSLGTTLAGTAFSRQEEYQADEIGIRYLRRAGYDPHAMVWMLETLGTIPESIIQKALPILATHPQAQKRIDRAIEVIEKG